jgi:acyl-CoA-binding protein
MTDFEKAVKYVRGCKDQKGDSSNERKLEYYAFFKQATEGDCTGDRPGMFALTAKSKYDAWKAIEGLSKEDAMAKCRCSPSSCCSSCSLMLSVLFAKKADLNSRINCCPSFINRCGHCHGGQPDLGRVDRRVSVRLLPLAYAALELWYIDVGTSRLHRVQYNLQLVCVGVIN